MAYVDHPELPFQPDSPTSRDAAIRAHAFVGQQGAVVLAWFRARGEQGGTQRECAEALMIARASVCARVRALELSGALVKTAERRQNCAVYVVLR